MLGRGTGSFFEDRYNVADFGSDWVPYLVSAGKTTDGMLRLLQAQGITYLVCDANLMSWLTQSYEPHSAHVLGGMLAFSCRPRNNLTCYCVDDKTLYMVENAKAVWHAGAVPPGFG